MTDHVETMLRQAMADEAGRAPTPDDLAGEARRRVARRRRTMLESFAAAAAVVVGVLAVVAVLAVNRPAGTVVPPVDPAASLVAPMPVAAPAGTRLVGIGNAAIAVPERWGTNEVHCGTPQRDTVVIDVGVIGACLLPYPAGVESVELWQGKPRFDFVADEDVEVDGVAAQRQRTTCTKMFGGVLVCSGSLYLPSLRVSFRAESSTSAAEVDRILGWVRILPDAVGVPGYQVVDAGVPQEGDQERYVAALTDAGLAYEIRTEKRPAMPAGFVLGVSPAPGTMLAPGTPVTVTVVAEPEGPADEVRVDVSAESTDGEYRDLDDAEIRGGASIRLRVGDRIWAYASGKRDGTLAGALDGDALEVDGWKEGPNYPHSWVAVAPGRTTITLTVTADGAPIVLGAVTVVVR